MPCGDRPRGRGAAVGFLETVDDADAAGPVLEMYAEDRAGGGEVMNATRAFSLRPEVYAAWEQLAGAVSAPDLRRYELATLGAATRLRSSYCSLAHGRKVVDLGLLTPEQVTALATDPAQAPVAEQERAVVAFAGKVAGDATSITAEDVDVLRELGLSDAQVLDVVLAAAARCFFSTVLDATGTLADAGLAGLEPAAMRTALTVGRPVAPA